MWSDILYRLRAIFRNRAVESELDDEVAFHLEQQTEKLVRAGSSPEEALRLARIKLAGPEQLKEQCREARGIELWGSTVRDIQYALRQLRNSTGFALVSVLLLALGIGANTAIFSLLNAVTLRSLPVKDPPSLFTFKWSATKAPSYNGYSSFEGCYGNDDHTTNSGCSFSYPAFRNFQNNSRAFTQVAAFAGPAQMTLSGAGAARFAQVELVSGNFLQTLGVSTALGRNLRSEDDTPSAPRVVVLSYGFWQSVFAGDPAAIGKTVRLNGVPVTVAGVTQPEFNRLSPGRLYEMWMPLAAAKGTGIPWVRLPLEDDKSWLLSLVGRLRPGITQAQAQEEVSVAFSNDLLNGSKLAAKNSQPRIELIPANEGFTGIRSDLAKPLSILTWAVAIVLAITCANMAGLLIARAAARRREMAVRIAIGASRARIFRQLLTESLLLSVAGGLLGVLFAYAGVRSLVTFLSESGGNRHLDLQIAPDGRTLAFLAGASILSGIVFGILPALRSAQVDPASPEVKGGRRRFMQALSLAGGRSQFGNSLVVLQIALTVVLLFGAGLCVRTLHNLRSVGAGFDPNNILLFAIDPSMSGYKEAQNRRFLQDLRKRLAALPGVAHVSYSSDALLAGGLWTVDVKIEGRNDKNKIILKMLAVGPDFFETLHVPLLAGRSFTPHEFDSAEKVAAVNAAFVRKYFGSRSPLGLHFSDTEPKAVPVQIVAVVGDARYEGLRGDIAPTVYVPVEGKYGAIFEVKTALDPESFISAIRRIVSGLDSNLPLSDFRTQRQQIDQLLFIERLVTNLATLFGLLALILTCVGVYGLLAYEVTKRTRETGIRIAVGAQASTVVAAIMRESLWLVLAGLAIGIPISLAVARVLTAMLFAVQPNDPVVLGAAAIVLLTVAGLAAFIPARRAAHVDPMIALRHE